ncbi:TadE/TadG family type IV pilus assembly protein [Burkholderia sp. BCC0322]|uniref:TadE/TadG family type IV pilus assembly protein n=1 Tax=unclassified Burkholderia TaxID=2613784 RepID=UPI00158C1F36|nr:TadE/TadG family type IV pilus assembly protein [Burkholderia sp. BCC0322]
MWSKNPRITFKHQTGTVMRKRKQRGVVTVEFSLLLPVLLLILLGIAQFSWMISNFIIVTYATSVGAHQLASERGFSTPYSDTVSSITNALGPIRTGINISTSVNGSPCTSDSTCQAALGTMANALAAGSTVTVTIAHAFSPLYSGSWGSLANLMPKNITSTMTEVIQ